MGAHSRDDAKREAWRLVGGAATVPSGSPQPLYPGDWITQDQKVLFSYFNAGSDTAIILKAVWAAPDGGGCGGGCK